MDFTSASAVIPASAVVPLAGAALMAGFSRLLPRWARDVIAIAVAIATCALTLILMVAGGRPPDDLLVLRLASRPGAW